MKVFNLTDLYELMQLHAAELRKCRTIRTVGTQLKHSNSVLESSHVIYSTSSIANDPSVACYLKPCEVFGYRRLPVHSVCTCSCPEPASA